MAYKIIDYDNVLESNNFEIFKSAENDYIRGSVCFCAVCDKDDAVPSFIRLTICCSNYRNIKGDISRDEYMDLARNFTTLSLAGSISLSLRHGWMSSNWVYSECGKKCSCILSRCDNRSLDNAELILLKITDVVTFGIEDKAEFTFDFYDVSRKHIGCEKIFIVKTFSGTAAYNALQASKYTLSPTDTPFLFWTEQSQGVITAIKEDIAPFYTNSSFAEFSKPKLLPCTVSYMPPQIKSITFETGKPNKIVWDTAFCVRTRLRFTNSVTTGDEGFFNVTNNKEFSNVDWNTEKYVHFRFEGYLYQIDTVIYNTKKCNISTYAESLEQRVYCFLDSGCRLMKLMWKPSGKPFTFYVSGTPACHGYEIKTQGKTEWEFPFQYADEDYSEIKLCYGQEQLALVL